MKLLVDMNLSPRWVKTLIQAGIEAAHWSALGAPDASDATIMTFARDNGYVVLTHDLDFGTALALTHARGPSVIQVRAQNVLPERMGPLVLSVLRRYEAELTTGALVVVEASKSRVRVLPL